MKKILILAAGLLVLGSVAFGTWEDAPTRGLFPYWQSGGDWYSLMVYVNGSEETSDLLYVRFCDEHGNFCSDIGTAYGIRNGEMLTFSTAPEVPTWIPVTAGYGYVLWRADGGGLIHPYEVIYNRNTGTGYVVPAYPQDTGF